MSCSSLNPTPPSSFFPISFASIAAAVAPDTYVIGPSAVSTTASSAAHAVSPPRAGAAPLPMAIAPRPPLCRSARTAEAELLLMNRARSTVPTSTRPRACTATAARTATATRTRGRGVRREARGRRDGRGRERARKGGGHDN